MPSLNPLNIARMPKRTVMQLKSWTSGGIAASPVFTLPAECRLLTLAPREWLLISDSLGGENLQQHVLNQQHGIVAVNLSAGLVAVRVEGNGAREVIANNGGLDLHPTKFPLGTVTRTRLGQLPVIIDLIDAKPQFELYVGRSYVDYLCSWLKDAAAGQDGPKAAT